MVDFSIPDVSARLVWRFEPGAVEVLQLCEGPVVQRVQTLGFVPVCDLFVSRPFPLWLGCSGVFLFNVVLQLG